MKRTTVWSLLIIITLSAQAQVKRAQVKQEPVPEPPTIEENISAYHFFNAQQQINAEITALKKKRKPTESLDSLLAVVERLTLLRDAAQRITFIDSLVVPKKDFFEHFALSDESGRITSYARTFRTRDTLSCTVYHPEMGSDAYYARPQATGTSRLYASTQSAGDWSAGEPLAGLDGDMTQNYPFMLADGITLYYGAVNDKEGLGGYDIYTTRWDADNKRFRQPENLGMPFNSPANDYMVAIDELNNLGWFVTDRRQPADTVCIYIFIPPTIRRNWMDTATLTPTQLASRARLGSIAETQTDSVAVKAARKRLDEARMGTRAKTVTWDFTFVVAEGKTYHFITDFKTPETRAMAMRWHDADITIRASEQQIEAMRRQYAQANESRQAQLRAQILAMERDYEQQLDAQSKLENEIRQKENQ